MWRTAVPSDDAAIVRMCLALFAEDPASEPVPAAYIERTLRALREVPARGCALVLELDGEPVGYALLTSFWSNELGGETLLIDELYVDADQRGQRHATDLFARLAADNDLVASPPVALSLEVTAANARARGLYERLGFRAGNLTFRRRLQR